MCARAPTSHAYDNEKKPLKTLLTRLLTVRCACSIVTDVLMLESVFTDSRRRLFILSYLGSLTSTVSDNTK